MHLVELERNEQLALGKAISETLTEEDFVYWSHGVLRIVSACRSPLPEIEELLRILKDEESWSESKRVFHLIRDANLASERQGAGDQFLRGLLGLAENVAKVAYNAWGPVAPFDSDAGWWILPCACSALLGCNDAAARVLLQEAVKSPEQLVASTRAACG